MKETNYTEPEEYNNLPLRYKEAVQSFDKILKELENLKVGGATLGVYMYESFHSDLVLNLTETRNQIIKDCQPDEEELQKYMYED